MVLIWKTVTSSVRYLPDSPAGTDEVDTWQFALETQMLGTGDCEDSAILLADWLMTRGFDARVSLGRFAEQGGHAWVVVRLDGKAYLLEATNPYLDTATPPLAADVGSRYVAESQLDRDGFFVRAKPKSLWDGDYFTASKWIHVKTPHTIVQTGRYPIAAIPAWFGRSAAP
jgi:transglutaminase-like putative cysteine protease